MVERSEICADHGPPVISALTPFRAPRVLDDPERFLLFRTVSNNQNAVIQHEWLAEDFERMRNSMAVELKRISVDS